MVDMLNEDRKARALDTATICATIINWAGKQTKRPVKPEELMKTRANG